MQRRHLRVQALQIRIVAQDMIGQGESLFASGLGGKHAAREFGVDAVARQQPLDAQRVRRVHHHDAVDPGIGLAPTDLGQQRNGEYHQVGISGLDLVSQALAYARVDDGLQLAAVLRLREHVPAHGGAVQAALRIEHIRAEGGDDLGQALAACSNHLARGHVGVEHRHAQCRQGVGHGRLARGDATGHGHDEGFRAGFGHAVDANPALGRASVAATLPLPLPESMLPLDTPELPPLMLRRGEERRLRAGHLWVFSNEVDTEKTPLKAFEPGDAAMIVDYRGHALGSGYVNPNSLIAARLVDRSGHALDRSLVVHRLKVALSLRERLYSDAHYRLLFGESDGLPGLTVDRFGELCIAQATTAGMQRLIPEVTAALEKVLKPATLIWKNDSSARAMEGLESEVELALGEAPAEAEALEGGLRFGFDAMGGQKTGWFFDQRANRDRLQAYVAGRSVLDVFSYVGAWGLRAAAFGAESVDCVDASADAVARIAANAERNGLGDSVTAHRADAFDFLKAARAERRRWDVVILDPPAFVKRRKDIKEGALAYRRLAEAGMQVLSRDGILILCSCSHHMPRAALLEQIQAGARHLDRYVQCLEVLGQAPDHPIHPAIPETDYLKGFVIRVLPA